MAASTNMVVITRNPNTLEQEDINVTYLNPELFPTSGAVPTTSYQKADAAARAFCNLSNNTYVDAVITRSESISEILHS